MKLTSFQVPEIRDSNDNILQEGTYGKKTPLANKQNTGVIDYINNNLMAHEILFQEMGMSLDENGNPTIPDRVLVDIRGAQTEVLSAISNAKSTALQEVEDTKPVLQTYIDSCALSASNALVSETNAKTSETKAKTSETNAKTSETNASSSASSALTSKNAASTSASNAQTYAQQASQSATTASTKASEASDSADRAEDALSRLTSVMVYKGSVATYANLPKTNLKVGDFYNVSDTGANYTWTGTEWDETGAVVDISGKADIASLANVAMSGNYNDLSNKPTIPIVNNGTLTIQKNGTQVATFSANQGNNVVANITVPIKVSELTNDSKYLTEHQDISGKADKIDIYTKSEIDTSLAGYLPLTGGNMSGNLTFGDFAFKPFGTHIDIGYDYDAKKGAGLAFRSSNYSTDSQQGAFLMYARNGDGTTAQLEGYPNGRLVWNGKEVSDYVTEIYQSGGYWYRLYKSGWLEQGGVLDNGSNARSVDGWINWTMPFKDLNYIVFLTPEREGSGNRCMAFGFSEKAVDKIHLNAYGPGSSSDMCRYIQAFACGYAY